MLVSGAKLKEAIIIPGSLLAILILAIIAAPYRLTRIITFLNPSNDPQGNGYLNVQLSKILSNSGLWGQGFTFEPQVLPELHTDFIFTFITYTFGWAISIVLIGLIVTFLARVVLIAKQAKTSYAKLLISGIVALLGVQFIWNIFMNLGLAPISGLGLPFISYGGSQLVINGATIGIILSIYKRRNISQGYTMFQ
jgi:rod shape determining protein RodA